MKYPRLLLPSLAAILAVPLLAACGASGPAVAAPVAAAPCPVVASATPRSSALDALAEERVAAARKRVELLQAQFAKGAVSLSQVLAARRDVASATRDSGIRGDALVRALAEYRDAMVASVDVARARQANGAVGDDEAQVAREALAEAEYWLAEASEREGIPAPPRPASLAVAPPPPLTPPAPSSSAGSIPTVY